MPGTFLNSVGPFIIRELTGDARTLRLAGRSLPARPYSLAGEQRESTAWYPGAPVATMQVLGAMEDDTQIGGWWKDRFLGSRTEEAASLNGTPVITAVDLVAVVDDIRRKGQMVQVVWMHTARTGLLKRVSQKWHNAHDVEFELTFKWIARDEDDVATQLGQSEVDLSDKVRVSTGDVNAFQAALDAPLGTNPLALQGSFGSALNLLQGAVLDAQAAVQGALDGVLMPFSATRRLVAAFGFMVSTAGDTIEQAYSRVDRATHVFEGLKELADILVGEVLTATVENRRITRAARAARHNAARAQAQALRQVDPALNSVIVARDGDDLRRVSTDFYGTPDEWQGLARFNHLSSSRLSAGQVVLIPRDPSGAGEC